MCSLFHLSAFSDSTKNWEKESLLCFLLRICGIAEHGFPLSSVSPLWQFNAFSPSTYSLPRVAIEPAMYALYALSFLGAADMPFSL